MITIFAQHIQTYCQTIFAKMEENAIVITPGHHLAQELLTLFFRHKKKHAHLKPRCLAYTVFIRQLYDQFRHQFPSADKPLLLSTVQQKSLWAKVAAHTSHKVTPGLIDELHNAWRYHNAWHLDIHTPLFSHNIQTQQFQQWYTLFRAELKSLNAITEEELVGYLLKNKAALPSQTEVIWLCFDEYTPQQKSLQNLLQSQECTQLFLDWPQNPTPSLQWMAETPQEELTQLLAWLKECIKQGDQNIAVGIPDLTSQQQALTRLFSKHFSDFNFYPGNPLFDYPMVTQALGLLELDCRVIDYADVRLLLQTPFITGAQTEFTARAQLLQTGKGLLEPKIAMTNLVRQLNDTPILAQQLNTLQAYPLHASPSQWREEFKKRLHHFGFPGEHLLHSETYQIYQRIISLLDELASLEIIDSNMNLHQALRACREIGRSTYVQSQAPRGKIQILSLTEISGCIFDRIWVMGMDDQALPSRTKYSPFLPILLQKQLSSQKLIKRIQAGASKQCIFSFSKMQEDIPKSPNPLIKNLTPYIPLTHSELSSPKLITYEENYLVPFLEEEKSKGGTSILANQAKCPFRAFAAHRLNVKKPDGVSLGMDAREKGQLLHQIVEALWKNLETQEHLLALDELKLQQIIDTIIHNILKPQVELKSYRFSPLIQEIETSRLKTLVYKLIEWEKARPAFQISALEKAYSVQRQGIDFRVRLDRLDDIGSNKWVIDYKTTLPSQKPWDQERPEDPQLLFYALIDKNISGILFLQLKAGKLTCSGISIEEAKIPGIKNIPAQVWEEYIQKWEAQLTQLIAEFKQGNCQPSPTRTSLCQQCDYPALCRVNIN